MRRIIIATVLALVLAVSAAVPAFAFSTTADVTVSATPAIVSISNDPSAWTMNDSTATAGGDNVIRKATTYYSNDAGNLIAPAATVIDADCRFTVTNDGTVPVDIAIDMADFVGGLDPMVNSDLGTADVGKFGAKAYVSGGSNAGTPITVAGVADVIANLPDSTGNTKKWGLIVATQTDDFTDATLTDSAVTLTASEYTGG